MNLFIFFQNRILQFSFLIVVMTIFSCGLFSGEKYDAKIGNHVNFTLEYQPSEGELAFKQIVVLSNENNQTILEDDTQTKELKVYLDSLPINGIQTPMVFVYDLYLGWAIMNYETLEIHKDFAEIPKEQALLTKLRMMENPIWDYTQQ